MLSLDASSKTKRRTWSVRIEIGAYFINTVVEKRISAEFPEFDILHFFL
jgi:hypothetical protein